MPLRLLENKMVDLIVIIATLIPDSTFPRYTEFWPQLSINVNHIFRFVAFGQDILYKFFKHADGIQKVRYAL